MLELAPDLLPLLRAGETVAVVTVVRVARSAPRGAGAAMAVTRDARVIGSISGGCVETDAVALALAALGGGRGMVSRFGFSDEQAFAAGLACGGSIDAVISVIRPDDAVVVEALERAAAGRRAALGLVVAGDRAGQVVDVERVAPEAAAAARADGATREVGELLVLGSVPPARLLLLGAGEHAAALCRVATAAGLAVTVCDVWELLVTRERFPEAAELVVGIPHEFLRSLDDDDVDARTAVCVLTHDVRLDVPALREALRMPVGFVGAMGARSTVARRAELLRADGVGEQELARLHSPLGLDLGGASPAETALAALAEIVAVRHGGTGLPLRDRTGRLHPGVAAPAAAPTASSCAIG